MIDLDVNWSELLFFVTIFICSFLLLCAFFLLGVYRERTKERRLAYARKLKKKKATSEVLRIKSNDAILKKASNPNLKEFRVGKIEMEVYDGPQFNPLMGVLFEKGAPVTATGSLKSGWKMADYIEAHTLDTVCNFKFDDATLEAKQAVARKLGRNP